MVRRVDAAEAAGEIGPWEQDDVPSSIIPAGCEPARGEIASRREFKALGGTELTLGNGMKARWAFRLLHAAAGSRLLRQPLGPLGALEQSLPRRLTCTLTGARMLYRGACGSLCFDCSVLRMTEGRDAVRGRTAPTVPMNATCRQRDEPPLSAVGELLMQHARMCAQVYYKATDLLDDQVLLSVAAGALSEVPRQIWRSASLGVLLAQEQGLYGLKPEVQCPPLVLIWTHAPFPAFVHASCTPACLHARTFHHHRRPTPREGLWQGKAQLLQCILFQLGTWAAGPME